MKIIDTHVHIFERMTGMSNGIAMEPAGFGKVRRGGETIKILPAFLERTDSTVELLLASMDEAGVDKAVLMSNPFYGYHNQYLSECVKKYPERLRGVALVEATGGQASAEALEKIYKERTLIGMKFEVASSFQLEPDTTLTSKSVLPIFECCNVYGQPVFIHAFTDQDCEDIIHLSEWYPNIPFVLCHLGADASFRGGKAASNFERFLQLCRQRENVYFDISTVPEYFPSAYPYTAALQIIVTALEQVGAERLLWGTGYPGMLKMGTYRQLKDYILDSPKICEQDKCRIMGGNAEILFFSKWPLLK